MKTGIYILILRILKEINVTVGSLGLIKFKKGVYAYVGSSQNNLIKRVNRHKAKKKKLHWHIDYLTTNKNVKITNVFYKNAPKSEEDVTAKKLMNFGIPIKNFGSSDSKLNSHLFNIQNQDKIKEFGFKEE